MTRPAERGFTLAEMLVALAIFAMVSGIATALAFTTARTQAASGAALASLQSVLRARALLAADLAQAAPRPTLTEDGALLPAFVSTANGFVMVRGGVSGIAPSVQKIAWGFDGTRLLRQSWPALDGGQPDRAVVLLDGVTGFSMRVLGARGWSPQWRGARPQDLPRAVELTLARADGRAVTLRFLVAA